MPRDNDKDNDSRGRRDRPFGGKGRSGAARGPEKKFAKRGFGGKTEGEKRPRDGDARRPGGDRPFGDRPQRFNRDDRPGGNDKKRPYTPRSERGEARPAGRFQDRQFGDKKPYTPRVGGGEKRPYAPRGDRPQGDRPYSARPPRDGDRPRGDRPFGDRPERKFGGDKKFSRGAPDRGPRRDFVSRPDRGESKPWQKRDASSPDHAGRNSRPSRDGARSFDKPRDDKPRENRSSGDRPFR